MCTCTDCCTETSTMVIEHIKKFTAKMDIYASQC